jgi:hypothetical protein
MCHCYRKRLLVPRAAREAPLLASTCCAFSVAWGFLVFSIVSSARYVRIVRCFNLLCLKFRDPLVTLPLLVPPRCFPVLDSIVLVVIRNRIHFSNTHTYIYFYIRYIYKIAHNSTRTPFFGAPGMWEWQVNAHRHPLHHQAALNASTTETITLKPTFNSL